MNKQASELWEKVGHQYGEKVATKLHTQLLKKAAQLSDDERLNPNGELWVPEFMEAMLEGCIEKLHKLKRMHKHGSSTTAADSDLEAVAEVVEGNSFMSLRSPLKRLGLRNVDFQTEPLPMWTMKTRRGKTIAIVNKKYADADSSDIVVKDFVIGYQ